MCGLVGAWCASANLSMAVRAACDRLRHRGPDNEGHWFDAASGVALSHRRLAIVDLTESGAQPMASPCGQVHISYNGEIYNHRELRAQLGARAWRGSSDTETLLACVVEWGIERTLQAAIGMFALAIFDGRDGSLLLARDRFGEKPLYFGYAGDAFVFGSELKALRALPGFDSTIDRGALESYLRLGYVPTPHSIYTRCRKLPAATWLRLDAAGLARRELPEPRSYWSARSVALAGVANPLRIDAADATAELERLLRDAVRGQMLADVPLGAFLSGGVDSSTIVALMQSQSSTPVRTFTMGFEDPDFDESPDAAAVARHLGTQHTEVRVGAAEVLALVPRMAHIYDEPFADASQLPTCLVSAIARREVTVALSGDAGDELFGGYNRHAVAANWWPAIAKLPRGVRQVLAGIIELTRPQTWDRLAALARSAAPRGKGVTALGDKLQKLASVLHSADGQELYANLVSQRWRRPVLRGGGGNHPVKLDALPSLTEQMMLADTLTYLTDDVLTKVDRASMSVSLETRAPFLDPRVYEFAWRLPLDFKLRGRRGKWLVRQVLHKFVPPALVDRPKMGFAPPLDEWLRGPLREWADAQLSVARLNSEGFFDTDVVRKVWQDHLSRRRNAQHPLWTLLMFQAWLEQER